MRNIGGVDKSGKLLGFAAGLDWRNILQMLDIDGQSHEQKQKKNNGLFDYINPITGDSRIFTREDIDKMSIEEYTQNEKAIYAQLNKIGIPTNGDMRREEMTHGGVVHVSEYTRGNGTHVKDYYRSRPSI